MEEPYISEGIETDNFSIKELGYEKIPKNMYLVLGDNRTNSMDSRVFGAFQKKDIFRSNLLK